MNCFFYKYDPVLYFCIAPNMFLHMNDKIIFFFTINSVSFFDNALQNSALFSFSFFTDLKRNVNVNARDPRTFPA